MLGRPSPLSSWRFVGIPLVGALACHLAGCSRSPSQDPAGKPAATVDDPAAPAGGQDPPVTLTFWSWVPDIQNEIDLFERKHPHIRVKLVNAGQAAAEYTKLRIAVKAGSGAPDVVQLEFSELPSFVVTGDLLDLVPHGANNVKDQFVDWTWDQVSEGGKVYAIPQDTGPMGLLYRQDILEKHGIPVPRTWDAFAEAARKLHAADPSVYITNFASNSTAPLFGLGWQAGARPFTVASREQIGIALDDEGMKKVAAFWTPLIRDGLVTTDPDFTDQWFKGMAGGKYATWVGAAWGPVLLQSAAKESAGKWRAAPLPQWAPGENKAGNWGGSTSAVLKTTRHPEAAAAFAIFLNSDPESTRMFASKQFLFPATKAILADPAFNAEASPFYGGQKVNELFAAIAATVPTDFQWSPIQDYVHDLAIQTVGKAAVAKQDLTAALGAWQAAVTTYAVKQGFQVNTR